MPFDKKAYAKKYRAEHREKLLAYSKAYYHEKLKNDPKYKEKNRASSRKWNHKNRYYVSQYRYERRQAKKLEEKED